MLKSILVSLALGLCVLPAVAQERVADAATGPGLTSFNMAHSVIVPVGEGNDPFAKQLSAMRSFFDMVGSSCAAALERIADTCEITSITYNVRPGNEGMHPASGQPESIRVDGQVRLLIKLKASVGPVSIQNSDRRRPAPGAY